jgi:predicted nucleotidyltransferase
MLTNKKIKKIIDVIVKGYKPKKIMLFGSYACGNANKHSDLDLMIIKDTVVKKNKRAIPIHSLFNPYPYDMDIIVYTQEEFESTKNVINTIAYFVNKEGETVYESVL